nr:GTPase [uncultured Oscillibacter sp.]
MNKKMLEVLEEELDKLPDTKPDKTELLQNLQRLKTQEVNILLVGATGVGKSSTINALFDSEIATVGYSTDPETKFIERYELDNIVLWDSPGLGDSPENDAAYGLQIANALKSKNGSGELLIDVVAVLLDGSSKDLGTTYEIIEKVVAPYIENPQRIVIAINQCDLAMKGHGWSEESGPSSSLQMFLDEKAASVQKRILESTGIYTQPLYYSALYHYNISKLLAALLQAMPENKRFLVADTLNKDPDVWRKNDGVADYQQEIASVMKGSLSNALSSAKNGAIAGATIGTLVPVIGPAVGAAVGAALGFLGGLLGI